MLFLIHTLKCNGYPGNFVEGCINRFLSKRYNNDTGTRFGPEGKCVYLCLPYMGLHSDKVGRQLKRLVSAIAPWMKLCLFFKPSFKLSTLSKLKSPFPLLSESNVVYKVDCFDCDTFYIGMTTRRLRQRMKEHSDNSCSALFRHAVETKHIVDYMSPTVLAKDVHKQRLFIKEALLIKEHCAHRALNGNSGSADLNLW